MAAGAYPSTDNDNRPETVTLEAQNSEIAHEFSSRPMKRSVSLAGLLLKRSAALSSASADEDRFRDEQGLLWCAFAFAAGIAVYVILPVEPSWIALALVLCGTVLGALAAFRRQGAAGWQVLLLLAFLCGCAAGAMRTAGVDAPRLAEPMNAELTGQVLEWQGGPKQGRLVLAVETVNGHTASRRGFPERVRLRVPRGSDAGVGDRVRMRTRLFPPPGPVHPGGYDFSFRAYFSRIGATGFSFGPPENLGPAREASGLQAAALVAQLRRHLAERVRGSLEEGPEAALIVAVLVGDRGGIGEAQEEDLRAAGLAHILAISGLHMALFSGGTYGAALLLLALVPSLPLRWPTHKWAALAALAAAVVYLLLSGAGVATQRSFLMIALVFLGILVGRRGLTLRSVALAGLVLLVLAPERLFFPGFQMSFAAVICLVAVYDLWRRRERGLDIRPEQQGVAAGLLRFAGRWAAGLFVTALVAGLATGIIGAHHFGRVAPYGLIGNMLGMPVFSLLVMPMGVLALALMPFGLAAGPLWVMSQGVSLLLKIAHFTAGLDAGNGAFGKLDGGAASLLMAALFSGLLLPGRKRFAAVLPLVAGLYLAGQSRPPDVQISASGNRLAARDAGGQLRFAGRTNSFVNDLWFQVEGVSGDAIKSRKMTSPQRQCDREGCVVRAHRIASDHDGPEPVDGPLVIAVPRRLEALEADCRYADIIVSDLIAPGACGAGLIIDQKLRSMRGAVSIWLKHRETGPDPPDAVPASEDRSGSSETVRRFKPAIERMVFAIPDPPRPWHRPGSVTRQSLRSAIRDE
ncbi:ComEC/Rec2 family competence protein [Roseibium sp. Sym1]|uniref:ComEC/Rec2 family competence protein n=1 Tax=Roseibium sp. Sym1 TaxID=3016006 RepID=UPI0022B49196|nr:ComEC/Rec2 family competence protein [Roseibium sp. Sym1]